MNLRNGLILVLCLGFLTATVAPAVAGPVLAGVIDKHKSKHEGIHAKLKHKKAMAGGGHKLLKHGE